MYNYNDPVFTAQRKLVRWAREHEMLLDLKSKVIRWEVLETVSPLRIPVRYRVHYHLKSIVAIDEAQMPVYGDHHIVDFELPPGYPMETCRAYMVSDIWHPNIVSKGKDKGRICTQSDKFGTLYELPQLILRIGEILQYKNYLAELIEPFPFDLEVAKWVREFAEPKNIVNAKKGIATDSQQLLSDDAGGSEISKKFVIRSFRPNNNG